MQQHGPIPPARLLLRVALLFCLLPACTEDNPAGPPDAQNSDSPVRFVNFRSDTAVTENGEIVLRWTADSLVSPGKQVLIWMKDASQPDWRVYRTLARSLRSQTISLAGFAYSRLRFGIGFEGESLRDSSGSIERTSIYLRIFAPIHRSLIYLNQPNVFRWRRIPPDETGNNLLVDYARYGEGWQYLASVPAKQDSLVIDRLPTSNTSWFRLRFRLEHSAREFVVDSIAQVEFRINGLNAGDIIERGKPLGVTLKTSLPATPDVTTENVLSLSTDGGNNWMRVAADEYVTQPASDRCYLRYSNAWFGAEYIVGPFRIADNTQPFFQPAVGMRLRYLYVYSVDQGGVTVRADSSWVTIDVERDEVLPDRTVYYCKITRDAPGGSSTENGTLVQQNHGLRNISGSFLPFSTFSFPSILHSDISVLHYSARFGTPGTVGVSGKYMDVHRDRGVTSYSENTVTGVISRSGYGFAYTLL